MTDKNCIRFSVEARYDLTRSVELIDREKGIFRMWGKSRYCRGGRGMFDFEGGPMLMVGEDFYGFGEIAAIGGSNPNDPHFATPAKGIVVVYISVNYSEEGLKTIKSGKIKTKKNRKELK